MIKKNYFFVFVLALFIASTAFAQSQKPALLKFSDLQKYDPANETFRIEGYILDIYKCPPCPPGAMCKPCIPDNVTLVDRSDWSNLSTLKRLRIYTDKTDKFESRKKYLLTVKVKGNLAAGRPVDSVDLISIEKTGSEGVASLAGIWTGLSLCTIPTSPCNNENALYRLEEPDAAGNLKIQMDKIVKGKAELMGTVNCTYDSQTSTIKCVMENGGVWDFNVTGSTMTGTLTVADGRLYRKIAVKKQDHK